MGLCLCKEDKDSRSNNIFCCDCKATSSCQCYLKCGKRTGLIDARGRGGGTIGGGSYRPNSPFGAPSSISDPNCIIVPFAITEEVIAEQIIETLLILRTLVGNDQEAPSSMILLHKIAENEDGWNLVVSSLVKSIPLGDPLGPAVISLLLDDCPLPTKENAMQLSRHLDLANYKKYDIRQQRNMCIVLGCLAEKLAGQNSTILLNSEVMKFLISHLTVDVNPAVILYAIIALEKFAQTSENKTVIMKALLSSPEHPLMNLEKWVDSNDYEKRQVGFCAQWSLDNMFLVEERQFGYELVDNSGINVILNSYDVSEYLKIAPHGLEARCDASSFESVRSTFQVDTGIWYYEVLIVTEGVMQIGWATKASKFLNHEGYGIGDDEFSVAYDGCRQVMWHNAQSEPQAMPCWKPGDILGTYLDLDALEINFFLNGSIIKSHKDLFKHTKSGFFAAGSFMSFQQCQFNFGSQPFKYPPDKSFNNFNEYARLGDECRVVLPRRSPTVQTTVWLSSSYLPVQQDIFRHLKMEYLRKVSVKENSCNLCFDHIANVRLLPCEHCGFCSTCADQLENCPLCRHAIENKITLFDGIEIEP